MRAGFDADWLARLQAAANAPPRMPRVPLRAGEVAIGSVEPGSLERLKLPSSLLREHAGAWQLQGDVTATLDVVARAMREAGLAHVWRDEQLAVTDDRGRVLGTVERAAVRPLGITTFAVHLAGVAPDGRHWVQQRSLSKANDPGLWDTLMGGMVPACDSLEQALERETWEEAGLRLSQLHDLRYGGRVMTRRPSRDVTGGFIVECIDWYRCMVPHDVVPANQDGEVRQFALLAGNELARRLLRDEFTLEAALVLSQSAP